MKKLFFAFIAIASMTVEAQTIKDAVQYSTTELNGTARYRAMSGAFGALGGDLSSLNINPAGSAVFLNSSAAITLNIENSDNDVSFMNSFTSTSESNLDLGQVGAVMVFNNRNENNDWRKFTLGFNYNKTASFEDDFLAMGRNTRSIDRYFLGYADGIPLDLLVPYEDETVSELYSYLGENEGFGAQQAFLGLRSEVILADDPDDFTSTSYSSNVAPGTFDQEYSYAATGLNGKFAFNFATQFQDYLYLGINLNTHFINYDKFTSFYETNNNPGSGINEIYFENRLSTLGSGFSFQLGGLAKINDNVRAGLAYESPTWYTISEETTEYIETVNNDGVLAVNPNVINVYPDYKLQTPSTYTGSLAYLFGSQALISFDYSYKDYSTTKFKPKGDPEFAFQNSLMENELQGASSYRIGGEYRLAGWSLRGGYRFEESPYSDGSTIGDLTGYSLGVGYNFGNVKIDAAYDASEQDFNPQLFQVGLTGRAFINRTDNNFTLTVSFGI
ncbi:OmpP1/FadL family transporter [Salinimicrobium soli]|uniref:OmpP1/FadL family transporter n=1 Tax=Salinimicrobium soli TaxID=1254399 RepID=UPI003AB02301